MPGSPQRQPSSRLQLPVLAAVLLRAWLPYAERDEVIGDLGAEYAERRRRDGRAAAWRWLWRQVAGSVPVLARRTVWRGMTGFEPNAYRLQPGGPAVESWIMDMRYAARRLWSRPGYALLAVLTLALGAGGTAAIFSICRALLLDPLPLAREADVGVFWNPYDWSETEFLHLRPSFPGFQRVAAYRPDDLTMEQAGEPLRLVSGIASSAELFDVLAPRLCSAARSARATICRARSPSRS